MKEIEENMGESIVVEICERDMNGVYDYLKRTPMLIKKKYLKEKKTRYRGNVYSLTEEGIKHFNGKYDDINLEYTQEYDILPLLDKDKLYERIGKLEQKIEQEEDELALLKLAKELNF